MLLRGLDVSKSLRGIGSCAHTSNPWIVPKCPNEAIEGFVIIIDGQHVKRVRVSVCWTGWFGEFSGRAALAGISVHEDL